MVSSIQQTSHNVVLTQSSSSRSSIERGFIHSISSEFVDVDYLKNPGKKSMDISTSPHKRIIELHSRCPLKRGTHPDRMDLEQRYIPMDTIKISRSPDRLVCNTSECPTTKVCFSNARPPSSSMQCSIVRLESMGTDLSFSTSESLAQSADETKGVQRKSNKDNPRMAELKVFPPIQFYE